MMLRGMVVVLFLFSSLGFSEPLYLQDGLYQDTKSQMKVEVSPDELPGIVFVRMGPPSFARLWINIYTYDGYKERMPSIHLVDRLDKRAIPLDRSPENLYQKSVRRFPRDRIELIFKDGNAFSSYSRQFRLVINQVTGFLEEFESERGDAWKTWSGPFFKRYETVECQELLKTNLSSIYE